LALWEPSLRVKIPKIKRFQSIGNRGTRRNADYFAD